MPACSSGAGKSTLTNTLTNAGQQTGTIRTNDSRGRHTTTFRSIHFCVEGACIIDAPGLRTLRPDGDDDCINAAFEDIGQWAKQCQFRNCRHEPEPGCAVKENCDPDRLFSYHKLMRYIQRNQQTPLEKIAEWSRWKELKAEARPSGGKNHPFMLKVSAIMLICGTRSAKLAISPHTGASHGFIPHRPDCFAGFRRQPR